MTPFIGETSSDFAKRRSGQVPERSGTIVTVPEDGSGHFFIDCIVDGQSLRMVADTGATVVSLSHEDAKRLGLNVAERDYVQTLWTANGAIKGAPIKIESVKVGEIEIQDVQAVVLPPGRTNQSLLGMSFLSRLQGFEVSQGALVLKN